MILFYYQEHDEAAIVNYIEELLPLLEHSDFIHKYSWFVSRYYEVSSIINGIGSLYQTKTSLNYFYLFNYDTKSRQTYLRASSSPC